MTAKGQQDSQNDQEKLKLAIEHAKKFPNEKIAVVARRFGVIRSTLDQRMKGITQDRNKAHQIDQLFTPGEEKAMQTWCEEMNEVGFPVNKLMLREMAQFILDNRDCQHIVGVHWPDRFLKRHPTIELNFVKYQEKTRRKAEAEVDIQRSFYRILSITIRKYKVTPNNIWNCDEKGITMGRMTGREKVITRAGSRNSQRTITSDSSREFVTTLECCNALGEILPPFICWPGKTHRAHMYGWGGPHEDDATFTATGSGYMDNQAGLEFMEHHFIPHTSWDSQTVAAETMDPKGPRFNISPDSYEPHRILIVDGHSSHIHFSVIQKALEYNIHVLCLPPHSTHIMQPLDVGCFGVFTKAYKKELRQWMLREPHRDMTKKDFWEVLVAARNISYTVETIVAAWKSSGCFPVNRWRGAPNADKTPPPSTPKNSTIITSLATPCVLKSLAFQLRKSLKEPQVARDLAHQFENLALEKVTKYRDINSKSTTLTTLRSGKQLDSSSSKDLRHLGKSRLMDRREVLAQQTKLREREEQAALKEIRRLEREKAKLERQKPPLKRVRIILHVRPKPNEIAT